MIMLQITDVKTFMQKILLEKETAFDSFLLSEAAIHMDATYIIDGHINKGFYSDDDLCELERLSEEANQRFDSRMVRWGKVKSQVLSIISGKKQPLSFNIIFYLSHENTEKFMSKLDLSDSAAAPDGLMLRINFDDSTLKAVTGTVFNSFTLDKTVDLAWDEMIKKFFTSISVPYEEL